jgi:hypothetical protein
MRDWKCSVCHHEWQLSKEKNCDWCGAAPILLADNDNTAKSEVFRVFVETHLKRLEPKNVTNIVNGNKFMN